MRSRSRTRRRWRSGSRAVREGRHLDPAPGSRHDSHSSLCGDRPSPRFRGDAGFGSSASRSANAFSRSRGKPRAAPRLLASSDPQVIPEGRPTPGASDPRAPQSRPPQASSPIANFADRTPSIKDAWGMQKTPSRPSTPFGAGISSARGSDGEVLLTDDLHPDTGAVVDFFGTP